MAEISLAQALKQKNRLAKRVKDIQTTISTKNQIVKGGKKYGKVAALYAELQVLVDQLVELKSAIQRANEPIHGKIFKLAEVRGLISFMDQIPTSAGPEMSYAGTTVQYTVELDSAWQDAEKARLEKLADDLQDELDDFNARARVTVPD